MIGKFISSLRGKAGPPFRYIQYAGPEGKSEIFIQAKRLLFGWRDVQNVDNERRKAVIDAIECFYGLIESLRDVEREKDRREEAEAMITSSARNASPRWFFLHPGGSVSSEFPNGEPISVEGDIPDRTKELELLVKKYKLSDLIEGSPVHGHRLRGQRSVYTLKNQPAPSGEFIGDSPTLEWDPNRNQDGNRNQKRKGNQNQGQNQGNQNQGNQNRGDYY